MDDRPEWERDLEHDRVAVDMDQEYMTMDQLVNEIRRLVFHAVSLEPGSYAHEHFVETGHVLRFGCCARRRLRHDDD